MARDKKFMRDTSIYDMLEELDLMIDEKYLYLWLTANRHITVSGLYEVSRRAMCYDTGISRDRIDACLMHLADRGLVVYDAELAFVPRIPEEQNIESRRGWQSHLERMRSDKASWRSDLPGSPNLAYDAFLRHHAERFFEIDEAARMDAEDGSLDAENGSVDAAGGSVDADDGSADAEGVEIPRPHHDDTPPAVVGDATVITEDPDPADHPFDVAMAANGRRRRRRHPEGSPPDAASSHPLPEEVARDAPRDEASDHRSLDEASTKDPPEAKELHEMQETSEAAS
jgi:hypothetical protein